MQTYPIKRGCHTIFAFLQESNLELGRKNSNVLALQNTRLREKIKKQSRTHALLVSIVVVFALSWFPLNLLNIILDVHNIFEVSKLEKFVNVGSFVEF